MEIQNTLVKFNDDDDTLELQKQKHKLKREFLNYISQHDDILNKYHNLKIKSNEDQKVINELKEELSNMNKVSIISNMNKQIENLKKDNLLLAKQLDIYKKKEDKILEIDNISSIIDDEESEDQVELIEIENLFYYINYNSNPNEIYQAIESEDNDYDVGDFLGTYVNNKIIFTES